MDLKKFGDFLNEKFYIFVGVRVSVEEKGCENVCCKCVKKVIVYVFVFMNFIFY